MQSATTEKARKNTEGSQVLGLTYQRASFGTTLGTAAGRCAGEIQPPYWSNFENEEEPIYRKLQLVSMKRKKKLNMWRITG